MTIETKFDGELTTRYGGYEGGSKKSFCTPSRSTFDHGTTSRIVNEDQSFESWQQKWQIACSALLFSDLTFLVSFIAAVVCFSAGLQCLKTR